MSGGREDGTGDERRGAGGRSGRGRAVALAVLVVAASVLAGCTGVLSDGGGNDWTVGGEDAPDVVEQNMETNPATVFDRVEEIVGLETAEPSLAVRDRWRNLTVTTDELRYLTGDADANGTEIYGLAVRYNPRSSQFSINRDRVSEMDSQALEVEFATAYFNALLYENDVFDSASDQAMPIAGPQRMVATAYAEQYNGTYHDTNWLFDPDDSSRVAQVRLAAVQELWYDWVREQVDSPEGIPSLYEREDLPTTSEQVIHGTDEPARSLDLQLEKGDLWVGSGTDEGLGEVRTRALLAQRLDESTAQEAAAGWGADVLTEVTVSSDDSQVIVWAHRWDTPSDADEFEAAIGTYLDQRRDETDRVSFEYQRIDENRTLVLAGVGGGLDETQVTTENGTLTAWVGVSPEDG